MRRGLDSALLREIDRNEHEADSQAKQDQELAERANSFEQVKVFGFGCGSLEHSKALGYE